MADHTPTRADEIKAIHHEYKFFYQVLGGSLLVAIGILIGAIAFSSDLDRSAYFINLYTSLLSILVTVFVIDFLNRRRDEHRELRQLQQQLIRDAGSPNNEIAKNAFYQLDKLGWLTWFEETGDFGDLLKGARLYRANLQGVDAPFANLTGAKLMDANLQEAELGGAHLEWAKMAVANLKKANLSDANLQRADLTSATLEDANLSGANLTKAKLFMANLKRVNFSGANLQDAYLESTDLEGADFREANLQGADMWFACFKGANLSGANLKGTRLRLLFSSESALESESFDETTILPDGSHWTPDTDLTKFGCIIE